MIPRIYRVAKKMQNGLVSLLEFVHMERRELCNPSRQMAWIMDKWLFLALEQEVYKLSMALLKTTGVLSNHLRCQVQESPTGQRGDD